MDETYHRRSVTRRPLLVPEENAPDVRGVEHRDGRVALGDARGAVFFANRTTGRFPPPGRSVSRSEPLCRRSRPRARSRPPELRTTRGRTPAPGRCRASRRGFATRDGRRLEPAASRRSSRATRVRRRRLNKGEAGLCFRTPGEAGQDRGAGSRRLRRRWDRRRRLRAVVDELVATTAAAARRPSRAGSADARRHLAEEDQPSRAGARHAHHPRGRRGRPRAGRSSSGSAGETVAGGRVCVRGSWGRRRAAKRARRRRPGRFRRLRGCLGRFLGADAPALSVAAEAAKQDALSASSTCGGGRRMSSRRGTTKPTNSRACRAVNS